MKRDFKRRIALVGLVLTLGSCQLAHAQIGIAEVIKAGIKRVVRAVDLKVQRLQNRTIWLQNAQKVLENSLSKLRLQEISEWTNKHTEQYREHYQQFSQVRSAITGFRKVRQVVQIQLDLVQEYSEVWDLLKGDPVFSHDESVHMEKVYALILDRSLKNLEQVQSIVRSFHLAMSDLQRIQLINETINDLYGNYRDLKAFNRQNLILRFQRLSQKEKVGKVRELYNLSKTP